MTFCLDIEYKFELTNDTHPCIVSDLNLQNTTIDGIKVNGTFRMNEDKEMFHMGDTERVYKGKV